MGTLRIGRFMGRCTEIIMVVLVVLVFFAVFTTLLFRFFPSGISLNQILERGVVVAPGGERKILGIGEESEPAAAQLSEATNEVKSRHSRSIAWGEARTGMALFDRDAVQTLERSRAQIRFDSRNYVNLGSNTLVIIKQMARNRASQERRAAWVIADGELSGRLASARLEISTPTALARLHTAAAGGGTTDFRLSINPDQSSSLAVYGGEAQVSARGETVTVRENRGVTVCPGETPRVVELPPPPEGMLPAEGVSVPFRDRPPRVEFSWLPPAGTSAFHLQLAVDPGFKTILLDRRVGESRFIHGNLKQGVYYWRVASIRDGLVGKAGRPLRLEVKQSLAPPPLTVSFPTGEVRGERFLLRGKTSPGSTVFVGGKEVRTDGEGAFSGEVAIRPGMNLVTVEAFDGAGNAAYQSHYIQGRF